MSMDLTAPGCRIGGVFSAALVSALVLAVPHGWHTVKVNPKLRAACDPVTLMVVGSAQPTLGRDGWRAPARGQVLVAAGAQPGGERGGAVGGHPLHATTRSVTQAREAGTG